MRGLAGVDNLMRGVKQSLRGNAAPVQTDAAKAFFAFDENDFFAKVRRVKRRSVSAGTGTNNYNFRFDRVHRKLKLHRIFAEVFKGLPQVHREPRRRTAVNHAMVVAQRNRRE